MPKYRKNPVEIEARRFVDTPSAAEIVRWAGTPPIRPEIEPADGNAIALFITTLEGEMRADPGDWIINGVQGEFYPCKPDIFEATYVEVV